MLLGDLGEAARRALAGQSLDDIGLQELELIKQLGDTAYLAEQIHD